MNMLRAAVLVTGILLLQGNAMADPAAETGQEAERVNVNIEAQPLTAALNKWAEQTGFMVMVSTDGAALTAPRVVGSFTPEEALIRLLGESGYRYEFVNAGTVAVSKKEATTESGKPVG